MGYVQLTKNLGEHLGEVIVVVDVFQERKVVLAQLFQVHSMIGVCVEFLFLLLEHVVHHVGSFCRAVQLHGHVEVHRLDLIAAHTHNLRTVSEYVKVFLVLVECQ